MEKRSYNLLISCIYSTISAFFYLTFLIMLFEEERIFLRETNFFLMGPIMCIMFFIAVIFNWIGFATKNISFTSVYIGLSFFSTFISAQELFKFETSMTLGTLFVFYLPPIVLATIGYHRQKRINEQK